MSNVLNSGKVKLAVAPVVNGVIDKTKARYLRIISENFREAKQTDNSQELVDDRALQDIITVGKDSTGSFDFELSYGAFDDMFEAFLAGDWVDNEDGTMTLENGVEEKEFVFEKKVGEHYFVFYGMKANEFSITKSLRSKITGTFGFVGTKVEKNSESIFDLGIEDVEKNRIMSTYANLKEVNGLAKLTNFNYTISNNAELIEDLEGPKDVGLNQFRVSGSGTAFFIDDDLYNRFKDESRVPFSVRVEHSEDEYYEFSFKAPVITDISGIGGEAGLESKVFNDFNFECVKNEDTGLVIVITKGYKTEV